MTHRTRRSLAALCLAALLAPALGCASGEVAPEEGPLLVAVVTSGTLTDAPLEARARELLERRSYLEASEAFDELSRVELEPGHRAEFVFLAGEAALAGGEPYEAYELYTRLLRQFPTTPRFSLTVERIFLIGKLFCEGRAERPSWLFGVEMSDLAFGIEVLKSFQAARERHPLADDALHYVALAHGERRDWELAIESWRRLVELYPRSEWADTAQYRVATSVLELSDGVDYDKKPLLMGVTYLRDYLEDRPTGDHALEARERLQALEEDLAAQQLQVARYYLRRDHDYAAHVYLAAIRREYPLTAAARQAGELQARVPRPDPPPGRLDPGEPPSDPFRAAPARPTW